MTEPIANAMPASLVEALSILQGRLPKIERTQTATVRSDKGSYSYSYADLAAVSAAVLPLMAELGLAFLAKPTMVDGRFVLAYSLTHVSGQREDGEYPLPASGTPQAIGSAISYGRRYVLSAMIGVATVDDDDGAAASQTDKPAPVRVARARRRVASAEPDDADQPIIDTQRKAIMAGFGDLGYGGADNREARLQVAAKLAGLDTLGSTNDLTAEQAARVLDGIAERRRAQVQSAGPAA